MEFRQPACLGMGISHASTSQYLLLVSLLPLSPYEMAFPCGIADFPLCCLAPLSSSPANAAQIAGRSLSIGANQKSMGSFWEYCQADLHKTCNKIRFLKVGNGQAEHGCLWFLFLEQQAENSKWGGRCWKNNGRPFTVLGGPSVESHMLAQTRSIPVSGQVQSGFCTSQGCSDTLLEF